MDEVLRRQMERNLIWLPEKEIGYFPVRKNIYNDNYFDEYVRRESTQIAHCLNRFRIKLVNFYTKGLILDMGIGCGTFIKMRGGCLGYDVNPKAIKFLKKSKLYFNPYRKNLDEIKGITFFDSLEHIENPSQLLKKISHQFVFVSIPLFRNLEHLLRSKHFKKLEHYYYFTMDSFIDYMSSLGFKVLEWRDDEINCGREDIYTFVFQKGKYHENEI